MDRVKVHKSKNEKAHSSIPRIRCYYCNFYKITILKDISIDYEEVLDWEVRAHILEYQLITIKSVLQPYEIASSVEGRSKV